MKPLKGLTYDNVDLWGSVYRSSPENCLRRVEAVLWGSLGGDVTDLAWGIEEELRVLSPYLPNGEVYTPPGLEALFVAGKVK